MILEATSNPVFYESMNMSSKSNVTFWEHVFLPIQLFPDL